MSRDNQELGLVLWFEGLIVAADNRKGTTSLSQMDKLCCRWINKGMPENSCKDI
jgi:hypothetical protein